MNSKRIDCGTEGDMEVFGSRLHELSFPDSGFLLRQGYEGHESWYYKTCAGWFQIWGDVELPERAEARTTYSEVARRRSAEAWGQASLADGGCVRNLNYELFEKRSISRRRASARAGLC